MWSDVIGRDRGGGAVHRRDVRRRAPDRGRRRRGHGERAAERDLERQLRRRRATRSVPRSSWSAASSRCWPRAPARSATRAEALGAQLTAALSNLAEAVVVQDRKQRLVYANEAAADDARLPVRRRAARRGAAGPRVARRLLQRGRLAADAGAVPVAARARRRGRRTADGPRHQPRDGRGALARQQAARRARRPRRDQARGDRDRGHHRPEARGGRAAAARARRRGALVLAELRAHAAGGRRPRGAHARRLVRREHARPHTA